MATLNITRSELLCRTLSTRLFALQTLTSSTGCSVFQCCCRYKFEYESFMSLNHKYIQRYCWSIISREDAAWARILLELLLVGSVVLLVARRTNDRKVVGSRPTKIVCITVLTGNRMGVNCPLWPSLLLPSCRKSEFRLSALMDSDLAWVNGKSGRQS